MIKKVTLLGAIMALTLAGCGSGGHAHDAGFTLMDSGTSAMDSGTTTMDSATAVDSGTGGACAISDMGLTGTGCFPRCSMSTLSAVNACIGRTCVQGVLRADTTPSLVITPAGDAPIEVKCLQCYRIQLKSCIGEACPSEFNAWGMCTDAGGACTAENSALNSCISASSTYLPCAQARIRMCFGP